MAAATVKPAFGTLLKITSGSAITILEVTSLRLNLGRETIDVTHMESVSGYREFIGGLRSIGEVTADLNFLPGSTVNHQQLYERSFATDTVDTFTVTWSDGAVVWTFSGWVTGLAPSADVDGKLTWSITIQGTGAPTLP